MDMTERDFKILQKIVSKQTELSEMVRKYRIKTQNDLSTLDTVARRGFIGLIADIFELTKPLSDCVKNQLPLNNVVMKKFRNTSTHQYDIISNPVAFGCLIHCIDNALIKAIKNTIDGYVRIED